ncbi:hypothetical protein FQN57_000775 [Myotisia sp. PD_48]|nr:hypothetical protein FQN57_000775 [Myotisia sp. PD_48]
MDPDKYIWTHVFFPPKLPQKDDYDLAADRELSKAFLSALRGFQKYVPGDWAEEFASCLRMLAGTLELRAGEENLCAETLSGSIQNLIDGDALAVHLRAQNAGLIIRKRQTKYIFEAFELSASSASVIESKGRLVRHFPGPVVAMEASKVMNPGFIDTFTRCIADLDIRTPEEAVPISRKAQSSIPEIRDTVNPRFVTEMLVNILNALGGSFNTNRIQKRTRDDVLWENTLKPWRRSPQWLFLRVVVQLHLFRGGSELYKSFMVYFMATLLEKATDKMGPSEMVYIMQVKIARRVLKLEPQNNTSWLKYVQATVERSSSELKKIWRVIEQGDIRPALEFLYVDLRKDCALSLQTLAHYLDQADTRKLGLRRSTVPIEFCLRPIEQIADYLPNADKILTAGRNDIGLVLKDVESWVETYLPMWLKNNLDAADTCGRLAKLIYEYRRKALVEYESYPEDCSIMFLTFMELWVALDQCALKLTPLLKKYDPGFPDCFLDPLLLRSKCEILRLTRVEKYLKERKSGAIWGPEYLYDSAGLTHSFAVQYFNQSPTHQDLHQRIMRAAEKARSEKLAELKQKQEEYQDLIQRANALSCENVTVWKKWRSRSIHINNKCKKCILNTCASNVTIAVHEWPLPDVESMAKATVFELHTPESLCVWRDTTYDIIVHTLSEPNSKFAVQSTRVWKLSEYAGLADFIKPTSKFIQFASSTKPFTVSHYKVQRVSNAKAEAVCVNNGLKYCAYDSWASGWVSENFRTGCIRSQCTFEVPNGSFKRLQYAIGNTVHTSNEIVARQDLCPPDLCAHEYYNFGTLRAGHRLQWGNIARELASPSLDFNKEESFILIAQSILQVGPQSEGSPYRENHQVLANTGFGLSMLRILNHTLVSIEDNWQGATSIKIFIEISLRILTLTPSCEVKYECLTFLRRVRAITLRWLRALSNNILNGQLDENSVAELHLKVLEISLICRRSFGVDHSNIGSVFEKAEDFADYFESLIGVRDHLPPSFCSLSEPIRRMVRLHHRLNRALEPFIRQTFQLALPGLDHAIGQLWVGYKPCTSWVVLETPNQCWLTTNSSMGLKNSALVIHFNLLSGALLIDGAPLSRLPSVYEAHPTYQRLLGKRILSVLPSTYSDMSFETQGEVNGWQLHFCLRGNNLIIRALRDMQLWELIPDTELVGDFPTAFVLDYVHWQNLETGIIEWRPLAHPWTTSSDNWRLLSESGDKALRKGSKRLIDIRSPTAAYFSSTFEPLEKREHIHLELDLLEQQLEVILPRLDLNFTFRENGTGLESKQFRGMVVDEDQSTGTFSGLINKLVLRDLEQKKRIIIVPFGGISYERFGRHVRVRVKQSARRHIQIHVYEVDMLLNRLKDKGSLTTKLYKCLLHAVTSHHIPDTLVGKTGTEEALFILQGASIRSFYHLTDQDISILQELANLTPTQMFYPKNLKVMHTMKWKNLPSLSQHPRFRKLAQEVYASIKNQNLFHKEECGEIKGIQFCPSEQHLIDRMAIRNSAFRTDEFGAECFTTQYDSVYQSREMTNTSNKHQVSEIVNLVNEWATDLSPNSNLLTVFESWGKSLEARNPEIGDIATLGYSCTWLEPVKDILPKHWLTLQVLLSDSKENLHKYQITFFLATLAYSQHADMRTIHTLLAFATVKDLKRLDALAEDSFNLSEGYCPSRSRLVDTVQAYCFSKEEGPDYSQIPRLQDELWEDWENRRREIHHQKSEEQLEDFVTQLVSQWPVRKVTRSANERHHGYIKVGDATDKVNILFNDWFKNYRFKAYISTVDERLASLSMELRRKKITPYILNRLNILSPSSAYRTYMSLEEIFKSSPPKVIPLPDVNDRWLSRERKHIPDLSNLETFCSRVERYQSERFEKLYYDDLMDSLKSLQSEAATEYRLQEPAEVIRDGLQLYHQRCEDSLRELSNAVKLHLEPRSTASLVSCIVSDTFLWPRLPKNSLLSILAQRNTITISKAWKSVLLGLGLAIATTQRAGRLIGLISESDLIGELRNVGHIAWNPEDNPEWLLLEIENNLLIREPQVQVAMEMISPSAGENSTMQLNMGEGKSSVIVPMVAAALANTKKLVRVVVLKPLCNQMFALLVQRLGGLLQRRIYYLPISRSLRLGSGEHEQIRNIFAECMACGGILLIQPEHLLSFELMGSDRLLAGSIELGKNLIKTQNWLDAYARDILDESDEILSVNFELIYTIGVQRQVDFHPARWNIIEDVLKLTWGSVESVLEQFPEGLEVSKAGRNIRVLQLEAGRALIRIVAWKACNENLRGLSFQFLTEENRDILFRFITDSPYEEPEATVKSTIQHSEHAWRSLLLLKGLLGGGILIFCLADKRYRVNYGLDFQRTLLAVPYRAKDQPTVRSEFSHPDTTITLTFLSYYAAGLSEDELKLIFEKLLVGDQSEDEYAEWARQAAVPAMFRKLSGVNLQNSGQFHEIIFPLFRYNRKVIGYYLSHHVFPTYMREFPDKLSTSGWNIARQKRQLVTGFSGTNDSKYILPLSIKQRDLPEQSHTNALQLDYILRPENVFQKVHLPCTTGGLDTEFLLRVVVKAEPPVRVIIDVGALILELQNEQIAERWLSLTTNQDVQAVVYFNNNKIWVLNRDGVKAPLNASPYEEAMDQCLVYLDEAHTRGTDLKLPGDYRAVVTLGPAITKDRLVQACMRMRKLAKGQSVMFIAPPDIEAKILKTCGKAETQTIEVCDVIEWSISETWMHTRRCIPLWAVQGLRAQRHSNSWARLLANIEGDIVTEAESFLEKEALTVEERYGIRAVNADEKVLLQGAAESGLVGREPQINAIRAKCQEFGIASFRGASIQETQERELSPENEREQQKESPPSLEPARHVLHQDVRDFVLSGILKPGSKAIVPAFGVFQHTSAAKYFEKNAWAADLLATADFVRTVNVPTGQLMDLYLRPVHWVLCRQMKNQRRYVIVSPFEANELIPQIRNNQKVALLIYSPRTKSSSASLEDLSFCSLAGGNSLTIPSPGIQTSLNLFAGQTYFKSYEAYQNFCRMLGICYKKGTVARVGADGFIDPRDRTFFDQHMASCAFEKSPMDFLKKLIVIRRKGQGINHSHLGLILDGSLISESDFSIEDVTNDMDEGGDCI